MRKIPVKGQFAKHLISVSQNYQSHQKQENLEKLPQGRRAEEDMLAI